jgi:ribosomal protein S1
MKRYFITSAIDKKHRAILREDTFFNMELAVGTILDGKVTGITKFGALIALEGGKTGLVLYFGDFPLLCQ